MVIRRSYILISLLLITHLSSCRDTKDPEALIEEQKVSEHNKKGSRPNLLLVTLDTTRADRLGCYGYEKAKTPVIDSIAREGALFKKAFAQVPLTIPSHATILTGRYPYSHRVRDNGDSFLSPEEVTIAEVLKREGYWTGASVGAFVCDSGWGFGQGFDRYYERFTIENASHLNISKVSRRAEEVVDDAISFIEESNHPFFLWVHFYDPHAPYTPPEPFREEFKDRLYDGEIAYMDRELGRLIDFLKEKELYDNTLIVLAGDHGEGLGEHEEENHGIFIYNSTLHVPLVFKFPGQEYIGTIIENSVALADILPTITDYLGIPTPATVEGVDLIPFIQGRVVNKERNIYSESFYSRLHFGWSELRALQNDRFKLIFTPVREIYDLMEDNIEMKNLYDEMAEMDFAKKMEEEMLSILDREDKGSKQKMTASLDPERLEKLRALGYVGVSVDLSSLDRPLPDIKTKLPTLERFRQVRMMRGEGDNERAISILKKIIEENEYFIDAYIALGIRYSQNRMYKEAIDVFKRALEKAPDQTVVMIDLASTYLKMKSVEDAVPLLRRVLEIDSKNIAALTFLCNLFINAKDYKSARKFAERILKITHSVPIAFLAVGLYHFENGDLERAEERLLEALKLQPDLPDLHLTLAKIYMKKGDKEKALSLLEEEARLFQDNIKVYIPLIALYQEMQSFKEEAETIERFIVKSKKIDHMILYRLGLARFNNHEYDKAKEAIERGLRLKPDSWHLHLMMANIHDKLGDKEMAMHEKELAQRYYDKREEADTLYDTFSIE